MNIFKNDNTMIKIVKNTTLIILIILATVAIVTFFMGGFMFLFGVASIFIFLYYLLIYIGVRIITHKKNTNKQLLYTLYILVLIPIIWGLIDWESLFEFLLQGVQLNMR